ncbi:MAG: hypothetical protein APF81_26230 [Desulfosporosinus sp. BRH_c37]|nr:MAG: hypothetical protein APF81_26230 [Desulfosporosinus sp. BRH_c37]
MVKLSQGLELPEAIEEIVTTTQQNLRKGHLFYEYYAPLLYLKLKCAARDWYFPQFVEPIMNTGFSAVYIGSLNISESAMTRRYLGVRYSL